MFNFLLILRIACRGLMKSPAFVAVAVLTLAIGIGANTAMFSVVNAVLLRSMPIEKADHVVLVREASKSSPGQVVSMPNFREYRAQQKSMDSLSLWMAQSVNLTGEKRPDRIVGAFVSANYFDMLRVHPAMGRFFTAGEDQPGGENVAVLSNAMWVNRFGKDPEILSRTLRLNGEPYRVVGVLAHDFVDPVNDCDAYITHQHYPNYRDDPTVRTGLLVGRVKDGAGLATAAADLNVIAQRLAQADPVNNAGIHTELDRLQDLRVQDVKPALFMLSGGVTIVLLIVCANIANLLLSRGAARSREFAIRSALGARRRHLILQSIGESLLIAVIGGTAGLLIASWGVTGLVKISPLDLPLNGQGFLDVRVLLFSVAASLLTGLICGLAPAWQAIRLDPWASLGSSGKGAGTGASKVRTGFVISQVGLSVLLLIAAGLLVKSFAGLMASDPGLDTRNLLTMEYRVPKNKYPTTDKQWDFHHTMLQRVQALPGVKSAAIIQALPFSGNGGSVNFSIAGAAQAEAGQLPSAYYNLATPEYFSTAGIPLLRGRGFTQDDRKQSPAVVLVSKEFAERNFAGQDPIGKQLSFANPQLAAGMGGGPASAQIVGVVGNTMRFDLRDLRAPQIYFPYAQVTGIFGSLVVRTEGDPMAMAEAVRKAVWSVDPDQPVWKVRSLETLIGIRVAPDRALLSLMLGFAVIALILAMLGTYAVISYSVERRTTEIGVRMALGANPRDVLRLVLAQGLQLTAIGAVVGGVAALAAGRLLNNFLFQVSSRDPLVFVVALALMVLVGLLASLLPASKAAGVEPLVALRYE